MGKIIAISGLSAADSWAYGYDGFDRLKQATNLGNAALSESFNYTPNGNLLTRSRLASAFTYPAGGQPRPHAPNALGAASISYDGNGNMAGDGARVLQWE